MSMKLNEFFFNEEAINEFGTKKIKIKLSTKKMEELKITPKINPESSSKKKTATPKEVKTTATPKEVKTISAVPVVETTKEKLRPPITTDTVEEDFDEEVYDMTSYEKNITDKSFKKSKVLFASIEGIIVINKTFAGIVRAIYEYLNDVQLIKQNTMMNIIERHYREKGYVPIETLGISVQGQTAGRTVKEIFRQVIRNDITFRMEVQVEGEKQIFEHNL